VLLRDLFLNAWAEWQTAIRIMNFTIEHSTPGLIFSTEFSAFPAPKSKPLFQKRVAKIFSNKSKRRRAGITSVPFASSPTWKFSACTFVMNAISCARDRVPLLLLPDINAGVENFGLKPFTIPHEVPGSSYKTQYAACKSRLTERVTQLCSYKVLHCRRGKSTTTCIKWGVVITILH
jgi:hypothetical protein